jgi:hypothetical protein
MPFISQQPPSLQEVFSLSTPENMLHKLLWEVGLFKDSLDDRGLFGYRNSGFAAFNCAVTAAHCADWAWSAAGPETKTLLGNEFNFGLTGKDRSDVVAFCNALETINREFYICRRLANGAKHMRRGKQSHQVHASVEFSPRRSEVEGRYLVDFIIKDGEATVLATEVFDRMCNFWERLYRRVGFIEDRYVDGT